MRPGETADEFFERTRDRVGERHRQPERDRAAERVAVACRVLGGGETDLVAEPDLDRASLLQEIGQPGDRRSLRTARRSRRPSDRRPSGGRRGVRRPIVLGDRRRDTAVPVRRRRARRDRAAPAVLPRRGAHGADRGPSTRLRRVVRRAARRLRTCTAAIQLNSRLDAIGLDDCGVDLHETDLAGPQLTEDLPECRHVEHVLQAFTRGLEQDRERRVLRRDGEQVGGLLTLLPEWRASIGAPTWQQQCAPGALSEPRREQRGLRQGRDDEFVDVLRVDHEDVDVEFVGRLGESDHDAVVAPHRLDRQVVPIDQPLLDRHGPRRMHRRPEGTEHADTPIADLVAETFDDDGPVVGDGTGGLGLFARGTARRCRTANASSA